MHCLSSCIFLLFILTAIVDARVPIPSNSLSKDHDLQHHSAEPAWKAEEDDVYDDADDDDDDVTESRENLCEQGMNMIVQHHDLSKLDPTLFLAYCPQYDQRLASVMKKYNSNNMDNKRQILRRRELKKRLALRFLRKRMS
ncbi:unnamed protein product [Adineta ricciae]|uniref:Uncharacterized protein n=1 Tax=Adineta ricciae TaxID=249248 RepID=A0A814SUA3_ADIRI|nr:unnamed protein product [Adineta ricciae]CAF1151092.1 unnamed protein product [Adineta ricciae]